MDLLINSLIDTDEAALTQTLITRSIPITRTIPQLGPYPSQLIPLSKQSGGGD
jgi:hypothetical protein